jgi:hypothetical protein
MNYKSLLIIRRSVFISISLACLMFAGSALVDYDDWQVFAWWPAIAGVGGTFIILITAKVMGGAIAGRVWDELSQYEWAKAIRIGYWIALGLYPLFGFFLWLELIDYQRAFAAMSALTGGLPLLLFVLFDMQDTE